MYTKKKALITGVGGQDGSELAELLLGKDYEVYGLIRENSNLINIKHLIQNNRFKLIEGDLINRELMAFIIREHQYNEIYNLASQSNIRQSYDSIYDTFSDTLMGVLSIMEGMNKWSPETKLFQGGSSAIFGNSLDEDGYLREETRKEPVSPYGSAKLFAHNMGINLRENNGLFIINGIMFNHESCKFKKRPGIINTIVENAVEIKKGNKKEWHIPDLTIEINIGSSMDYIRAMWFLIQKNIPDDYIIGTDETYSIEYCVNFIFKKLGLDYKKYIKTEKKINNIKYKIDNSKIKNAGFTFMDNLDKLSDLIINKY